MLNAEEVTFSVGRHFNSFNVTSNITNEPVTNLLDAEFFLTQIKRIDDKKVELKLQCGIIIFTVYVKVGDIIQYDYDNITVTQIDDNYISGKSN